jgi:gas vesicle protein
MENTMAHESGTSTTTSVALGFALGALVGAGVALLLAPRSGKETRKRLADAGERWGDAAKKQIEHAGEIAHDIKRNTQSAVDDARRGFEQNQRSHDPAPMRTELTR